MTEAAQVPVWFGHDCPRRYFISQVNYRSMSELHFAQNQIRKK